MQIPRHSLDELRAANKTDKIVIVPLKEKPSRHSECKKRSRKSRSTSAPYLIASTATCDICFEADSSIYCNQCDQHMCINCALSHKRLQKLFPGHKLDNTYTETLSENSVSLTKSASKLTCTEHAQQLNMYCYDCKQLICLYCSMKDHMTHCHEFVEVAAPEIKERLIEQLAPLKEMQNDLTTAFSNIESAKKKIKGQKTTMMKHIEETFAELQIILKQQKGEIIRDVEMSVSNKLKVLSNQEQSLFSAYVLIKSVVDETEKCVEVSSDADIMMMHTDIQQHIDREIEKQSLWRHWQDESKANRKHSYRRHSENEANYKELFKHEATTRESSELEATTRKSSELEATTRESSELEATTRKSEATTRESSELEATSRKLEETTRRLLEATSVWLKVKAEPKIHHPDEFYRPRKCSISKKCDTSQESTQG